MENSNRHNLTKYSYLNQNNEEIEYFIGAEIAILLGYKNNTQAFVKNYFTPENPIKGMLLYHSVGTGKTCSAIAAASSTFERQGYTI